MKSFKEIFGPMLSPELNEDFRDAELLECKVDTELRILSLSVFTEDKLHESSIGEFLDVVSKNLKLNDIVVEFKHKEEQEVQLVDGVEIKKTEKISGIKR